MSLSVVYRSTALGLLLATSAATSAFFCSLTALGKDMDSELSCIPSGLAGGLSLVTLGVIVGHTYWPIKVVPGIGISVSSASTVSTISAIIYLTSKTRTSPSTFNSVFLATIAVSILSIILQTVLWTYAAIRLRIPDIVLPQTHNERPPRRSSIGTFGFSAYEMEVAAERDANSKWNALKSKVSPRLSSRKSVASSKTAVERMEEIDASIPDPETMPSPSAFDNWDTTQVAVLNRAAVIASQRFSRPPSFGGLGIIDAPMPPPPRVFASNNTIRSSKASTLIVADWNGVESLTTIEVPLQNFEYEHQHHDRETSPSPILEVPTPPSEAEIAQAVNEDESRTLQASEIASVLAFNAQTEREAEANRQASQSS